MIILGVTTPGIERLACEETARLLEEAGFEVVLQQGRALDVPGWIRLEVREEVEPQAWLESGPLMQSHSLYRVSIYRATLDWDGRTLESLLDAARATPLPELETAASFRVTCHRAGDHRFQSPEVEREVGAVYHKRYQTPARMREYELRVVIEIHERTAVIGYSLIRSKGLDRRYAWAYHPRITLRTTIAWAMLTHAGYVAAPGSLLDPCCGAGTILLEGALLAAPVPALVGSDRDESAVEGARANLEANGVTAARVSLRDLNELKPHLKAGEFRYIVTNPPYGARIGKRIDFHFLYQNLLAIASHALEPGGRIALLVERKQGAFEDVRKGFTKLIDHTRVRLSVGGLAPELVVLERR